jgi:hypothetical protein
MTPKTILTLVGILCAAASFVVATPLLLPVGVILIGVANFI